tara:strand:+ start:1544 stop:2041 length:498 start_codon:yes stop_codon:yes gene_type:complete
MDRGKTMKKNLPVTTVEREFPATQKLISSTDLKGRITHCNQAFVEVSGFSREELIGKPHNIVRHPDMPPEAFGNLWAHLKAGKSIHRWTDRVAPSTAFLVLVLVLALTLLAGGRHARNVPEHRRGVGARGGYGGQGPAGPGDDRPGDVGDRLHPGRHRPVETDRA